jgi:hypothetical protein
VEREEDEIAYLQKGWEIEVVNAEEATDDREMKTPAWYKPE